MLTRDLRGCALLLILTLLTLSSIPVHAAEEGLMKGLTFYNGFEDRNLTAASAMGDPNEKEMGKGVQTTEGISGKGIMIPEERELSYRISGNMDSFSSSVSFWIKPDKELLLRKVQATAGNFWRLPLFETKWSDTKLFITIMRGYPVAGPPRVYFYDWHADTGPAGGPARQLLWEDLEGWHHIVISWGNNKKRLFWDGKLAEESQGPTGWNLAARFVLYPLGSTAYDEMAVWNRMLAEDEVKRLYERGKARKPLSTDMAAVRTSENLTPQALPGANMLKNSSFELGLYGWELVYPQMPAQSLLDHADKMDGESSLKIPPRPATGRKNYAPGLLQGPFSMEQGKPYTLTLWMKSSVKKPMALIKLETADINQTVLLTGEWKKYELKGKTYRSSDTMGHVEISFEGSGEGYWWIDDVVLLQGESSAELRPRSRPEYGMTTDKTSNIFKKDDKIILNVHAKGSGPFKPVNGEIVIEDFWAKEIYSKKILIKAKSQALDIPVRHYGPQRGMLKIHGAVEAEMNFAVLPFTSDESEKNGEFLGAELNPNDFELSASRALGIKWVVPISVSGATLWRHLEPTRGNFVWNEQSDIDNYRKYGFKVLGIIDHAPLWAATIKNWKQVPKREFLDDFENYVLQTVSHYKSDIKDWLIWDEANLQEKEGMTLDYYLEMLARAHRAAKKANPSSNVAGPGFSGGWTEEFVKKGGLKHTDIFSMDLWANRYKNISKYKQLSTSDNKTRPFWDHGTGLSSRTFYRQIPESRKAQASAPTYHEASIMMAKQLIERKAAGVEKVFYYWITKQPLTPSHSSMSIFEYDGSIRPTGVVFSIVGQFVATLTFKKELSLDRSIRAFLFLDGNRPVIALWAEREGFNEDEMHMIKESRALGETDGNRKAVYVNIHTSLKTAEIKLLDMMLNNIKDGTVKEDRGISLTIGEEPLFLIGQNISLENIERALSSERSVKK